MAAPRPVEPPRVTGNTGGTGFQGSALIRSNHDDNTAPLTAVAGGPDDPRVSGDFASYNARYATAMAPLRQQSTDTQAQANQLYATEGNRSAAARNLETDALIQRSNADNATPDFASPTGQFVPGDLNGYVRQRQIDSQRELDQAMGRTAMTPAAEQANADAQLAALQNRPNDRYMVYHQADQELKNNRRLANERQRIEQAIPGRTGQVLGQAYEMAGGLDPSGMAGAAHDRIVSMRGSGKGAAAPASSCTTCSAAAPAPAPAPAAAPARAAPPPPPAPPARTIPAAAFPKPFPDPPPGAVRTSQIESVPINKVTGIYQGEVRQSTVDAKAASIGGMLDGGPGTAPVVKLMADPQSPGNYAIIDGSHTYAAYKQLGVTDIPGQVYNAEGGQNFLNKQGAFDPSARFSTSELRTVPEFSGSPAQQRAARPSASP